MNGLVDINLNEKKVTLRFSYQGSIIMEKITAERILNGEHTNDAIIFTDVVYSGLYGNAMATRQAIPDYEFAYNLVDEMANTMDDFAAEKAKIEKAYFESKFGADFMQRVIDFKKKADEKAELLKQDLKENTKS